MWCYANMMNIYSVLYMWLLSTCHMIIGMQCKCSSMNLMTDTLTHCAVTAKVLLR